MSLRQRVRSLSSAPRRAMAAGLVLAAVVAAPASAYVVVTSDNRVFTVPTRPELSGDLVTFTLDGDPVSLRVYDVNLRATNELNALMDSGASAREVQARIAALPQAVPVDQRLMASSPLHREMQEKAARESGMRAAHEGTLPPPSSTASMRDSAPPRSSSRFAEDARQAMEDAEMQYDPPNTRKASRRSSRASMEEDAEMQYDPRNTRKSSRQSAPGTPPPPSYAPPSSSMPPPSYTAAPSASAAMDTGERVGDLDAEIAAEQAYLRQLTAGEVTVDDLDREIAKSMDKIAKLQRRREKAASKADKSMPPEPAPAPATYGGRYPAGSREAGWEQELAESRARLQELRSQQASMPGGTSQSRESLDEEIGELEHRIARLQSKLERVSSP